MSEESNETAAAPEPGAAQAAGAPSKDETNMAMLTHLLALSGYFTGGFGMVVGPLILWLVKKDTMPFVDDQGKEAVNFNISFMIYMLVSAVLIVVVIGLFLVIILGILHLIFVIMAAVKASSGEAYRYPMTIRFVK
jgi:uncharacterized Tic20 family protein